jgi:hypothetical protein
VCAAPTDLPSGYGIRGSSIFQRTRPGYTIDIGQWDTHVGTIIYHLDYDLQTAFAPIGLMTVNPQLLVARKGFPADDPSCGPAALAKRSWLICTASTREVSTIPLFQVVTKNRKLVCESTHRSWYLTYLISFHVRPGRTSRLLSCGPNWALICLLPDHDLLRCLTIHQSAKARDALRQRSIGWYRTPLRRQL